MDIEEAIEQFKSWIEYEKNNKFKIKEADKLIEIQETILLAYEKEKEKNKKIENELEEHIKFCEQEAEGSLNNKICHISLKFEKSLLNILKRGVSK